VDRHQLEAAAVTDGSVSRRGVLSAAAAAAFSSACSSSQRHASRLTYLLRTEPTSFDPAKALGGGELWVFAALFEPLLQPHPETMEPIAGLATHYRVSADGRQYIFYLRGHSAPEGIRLADRESLGTSFSGRCAAAPFSVPARWSDGTPITAHDIVYSWRRYVTPETACVSANLLFYVSGAEKIAAGKAAADTLGVHAAAEFELHVELRAPASDFLAVCCTEATLPVPMHAIEQARSRGAESSWTDPGRMVTSGPFVLKEYRPRERVLVVKNPRYFDSALVGIDEIEFSAGDGATVLNLFRAGLADSMEGRVLPLQLAPGLLTTPGFHVRPACACHNWRISTRRPPLDNVLLRYALNMATDKLATVRFLGTGQTPAATRVPPLNGYDPPTRILVDVNGRSCDVLAYDPPTARELWAAGAFPVDRVKLPIHYFGRVDSRLLAEILQQQWRENLGIETVLMPHEPSVHVHDNLTLGDFSGVAEDSFFANYADPYDFLSLYTATYPNWTGSEFDRSLTAATSTPDPVLRMRSLSECEHQLLRAMPFVPVYFDTWVYLERPELRGLTLSPRGIPAFKYAWIDVTRRHA
jgi:oligopeptide transport system substrate-binding protein